MELWDAYKKDGTPAGCDLVRGEPIPEGLYHIVSEVLVIHTDGTYLVTQRSLSKPNNPGKFEIGSGGSVIKGETPYNAAVRELKEETGITTDELTFAYALNNFKSTIFCGYICVTDSPKNSVVLQKDETISYKWLDKKQLIEFMNSDKFSSGSAKRWLPFIDVKER